MLDLLLSRYNNIEYINNLLWHDGIRLMNKAVEKCSEQRHWDLYCTAYPNMDETTFISFEQFKKPKIKVENKTTEVKTNKDAIEKAEAIKRKFEMQEKQREMG